MSKQEPNNPQPKVSIATDQTETKELVKIHKTIAEAAAEAVPQLVEKPNTAFFTAYPEKVDDDAKRRAYRNKLRNALGKGLNARKKLLARSLFISDEDGQIRIFVQDLDAI